MPLEGVLSIDQGSYGSLTMVSWFEFLASKEDFKASMETLGCALVVVPLSSRVLGKTGLLLRSLI